MDRDELMAGPQIRSVRCLINRLRDENGNSIIETALVIPVFLLLIFGFIAFCLVIFGMGNMNFASRAAGRYASMHSSTSYKATTHQDLVNIITPYIYSYPANTWNVSTTYYGGNVPGGGVDVNVTITYQFSVMGYSYSGITYSSTAENSIVQ